MFFIMLREDFSTINQKNLLLLENKELFTDEENLKKNVLKISSQSINNNSIISEIEIDNEMDNEIDNEIENETSISSEDDETEDLQTEYAELSDFDGPSEEDEEMSTKSDYTVIIVSVVIGLIISIILGIILTNINKR